MPQKHGLLTSWGLALALLPMGACAAGLSDEPSPNISWRGFVEGELQSNDAPLSAAYWQHHALSSTPQTYWWQWQASAGVQARLGDHLWHITQVDQGQLMANGNTLRLAALNETGQQTTTAATDGQYPVHARAWRLKGMAVGARFSLPLSEGWTWHWMPELMQIQEYREDIADLQWTQAGNSSRLIGTFNQVGTRQFGYLSEERPDSGKAALLHTRLRWDSPYGPLSLKIDNAWSRLDFSNIHYSNTDYQIQAQDKQLQLSNVPSVSGSYGLQRLRTQLPRVWQWQWRPNASSPLELGQKGVNGQANYYVAYTQSWKKVQFRVETVQAKNWTLGIKSDLFDKQMTVALAIMADARWRHHTWSGFLLQWRH